MSIRLSPRLRAQLKESDLEVTIPDLHCQGGWSGVFDRESPSLYLELGTGKDPHLIEQAARHPERAYVGLEHSKKKLEKVHSKAARRRIGNLRLLRADIFRVLDLVFDDASVDGVYMLFPDPWPKKRHHKNRMVQTSLMDILASKMRPGASFELRTDHAEYRDQMLAVLDSHPRFRNIDGVGAYGKEPRADRVHIPTLFETKFKNRGLDLNFLYFERIATADEPEAREPYSLAGLDDYNPLRGSPDETHPWLPERAAHNDDEDSDVDELWAD